MEWARAAVFAGDPRVWRAAALAAVPLVLLAAYWCLRPRDYFTGTDNVETFGFIAPAEPNQPLCVPGLRLPAGTARVRLQLTSQTRLRPALALTLQRPGQPPVHSALAPVPAGRDSYADFRVPRVGAASAARPATACVTAAAAVEWGGTPLPAPPVVGAPTMQGKPIAGRIAVWYLPPQGSTRSYIARASEILRRASLFRPGLVGPWLYALILLGVLPALALLAIRCLALAAAAPGGRFDGRRMALWLYAIAATNFACWSLITPPFQAPDEVDHFAYTQSVVERGESPSPDPGSPLARWSSSETLALEAMGFNSDHQVGDTRPPWEAGQERRWRETAARQHPSTSDGGGSETAATHGPAYYTAIAPAYLLASGSPFDQLTLMRIASALLGALTVLFAFLLGRELAPGRPWVAVLAALLIAYQPMYGFISGSVNNDVGVNAASAALMWLLIRVMRRGWSPWTSLALGATLLALPAIKQTAFSLYPVAGLGIAIALWRHRRRSELPGLAAAAGGAVAAWWLAKRLQSALHPAGVAAAAVAGAASSAVSEALAHPFGYLAYLWEVFLPRLPFMARHFPTSTPAGYEIFVERGFGAFGWYDVLFPPWLFKLIFAVMVVIALLGVRAAFRERVWLRAHAGEVAVIVLAPLAVVAGVEAAFYTTGMRPVLAEFGRYAFPAIAPLALVVAGSMHGLGRRLAVT
ncbi:MAG TPA: DUF2142 domain-containing protein, partial [Solirubrobacteraceae bacterium]